MSSSVDLGAAQSVAEGYSFVVETQVNRTDDALVVVTTDPEPEPESEPETEPEPDPETEVEEGDETGDFADVPEDKVRCRECGEGFNAIAYAHLQTHDMSTEDYREEYGEDVPMTPEDETRGEATGEDEGEDEGDDKEDEEPEPDPEPEPTYGDMVGELSALGLAESNFTDPFEETGAYPSEGDEDGNELHIFKPA